MREVKKNKKAKGELKTKDKQAGDLMLKGIGLEDDMCIDFEAGKDSEDDGFIAGRKLALKAKGSKRSRAAAAESDDSEDSDDDDNPARKRPKGKAGNESGVIKIKQDNALHLRYIRTFSIFIIFMHTSIYTYICSCYTSMWSCAYMCNFHMCTLITCTYIYIYISIYLKLLCRYTYKQTNCMCIRMPI
jgi:hypothetical protein